MAKVITARYETVGSFLRPAELKQARADLEAGTITKAQLKEVEDRCIRDLVNKQKALGYQVLTDGEFRRATWHLDFMWGFDGVDHHKTETGVPFVGEDAMIDDTYLVGKFGLSGEHPFVDHFRFVHNLADENTFAKQTMPAPAQTFEQFWLPKRRQGTLQYYKGVEDLCDDIAQAYITVLRQLYDAGCRVVQFDDTSWALLADKTAPVVFGCDEAGIMELQVIQKDLNNRVIAGAPRGLEINTHVCRGNFHSTYLGTGPYDPVADVLFGEENIDTYYLEYDDERSGSFEPLAKISGHKRVVLGLITTKTPQLEDKDAIIARIHEATKYIPLERLSLSPQCGFASCEIGNKLTEEEQWAKLALVKEIAEEVWGK